MSQYEYKVTRCDDGFGFYEDHLNEIAQEGWELFAVGKSDMWSQKYGRTLPRDVYYWRREKGGYHV